MSEVADTKRDVQLPPASMGLAEHLRHDWVCIASEGTKIEDVLKPMYWSHVAVKFETFDRIEVREETGAWLLEAVVTRAERNWASVVMLNHYPLDTAEADIDETVGAQHQVKWCGPVNKWCILRKGTGQTIEMKIESKRDALGRLAQYEQTLRS